MKWPISGTHLNKPKTQQQNPKYYSKYENVTSA